MSFVINRRFNISGAKRIVVVTAYTIVLLLDLEPMPSHSDSRGSNGFNENVL